MRTAYKTGPYGCTVAVERRHNNWYLRTWDAKLKRARYKSTGTRDLEEAKVLAELLVKSLVDGEEERRRKLPRNLRKIQFALVEQQRTGQALACSIDRPCRICLSAEAFGSWDPTPYKSVVYLVQSLENLLVKIGVAQELGARFSTLRSASPSPLHLVGVLPRAGIELERDLHAYFVDFRDHGEWHHVSPSLVRLAHKYRTRFPIIIPYNVLYDVCCKPEALATHT